jgi:hypothetical protein
MSDSGNDPTPIAHYGIRRETDDAVLFKIEDGLLGETVWIPKSQILDQNDDLFEIPEWLAIERGLV